MFEENHTKDAVLPLSFSFEAALPTEPAAYCVSIAYQSLRHGLRRATSLYTREALIRAESNMARRSILLCMFNKLDLSLLQIRQKMMLSKIRT